MIVFFILSLIFSLLGPLPVYAIYDPLSVPNNRFGIHIADFNDLPEVAPLVNSTGGDWGYVTLVSSDSDRDSNRWQLLFNLMRRSHLIPIVRIATQVKDNVWIKPNQEKFEEIAAFLDRLNWPTQNRYVVLWNEPNHAKEWGGTIDPGEYASDFVTLAKKLKRASSDFFILPAGLDVSAASDGESIDAAIFLQRTINANPEFLTLVDGWTSHAYPNPGFSGSVSAWGRGTLRSFDWELSYLRQLGLTKDLPVFITETGWTHSSGKSFAPQLLSETQVGQNLLAAASLVWSDPRVVAVTPFVFSYQDEPFDHFSWKKYRQNAYYDQYFRYQALTKIRGEPQQQESFTFSPPLLPTQLVARSSYNLTTQIANNGQSILKQEDGYELVVEDSQQALQQVLIDALPTIEPGEKGNLTIHLKTNKTAGIYPISFKLKHRSRASEVLKENLVLVPPPALHLEAQLGWRKTSDATEATVLIYDLENNLIEKFTGLKLQNGTLDVPGLVDIVPGEKYRTVLVVPYYLPRQQTGVLVKTVTDIRFKRLLPLDFDNDGTLTLHDLVALAQTKPNTVFARFVSP